MTQSPQEKPSEGSQDETTGFQHPNLDLKNQTKPSVAEIMQSIRQIFQNNPNIPMKIFSSTQWLTNVLKTTL